MKINTFKFNVIGFLCMLALVAGFASGCGKKVDAGAEKAATSAAQMWLAVIDNGDYAQSWRNSSAFFQSAVTEEKWEAAMKTFRMPLGNLVSRELKSAKATAGLPGAPAGQYVVMQFETSFAGNKTAIETVTFILEKDGQWKSCGYFIK